MSLHDLWEIKYIAYNYYTLMFTSTLESTLESSEVSRLQSLCTDYIMNSDGQQFYQYQQNGQSPIASKH